MTDAVRTLIQVPPSAARGSIVDIRATIGHPMETGFRIDNDGRTLPRNLIRRFSCHLDGQRVFAAELHAAMSANPYIAFALRATASGTLSFRWEGDRGFSYTETRPLVVNGAT
ncbi:MAG: thiosulfate oxidation carrier complex protein SoxZ [Aquabacterium sp.]